MRERTPLRVGADMAAAVLLLVTKTLSVHVQRSFKVAFVVLPWLVLLWQSYLTFKFPVKPDRYQHSFSEHVGDRLVAYALLLRSPFKVENLGMKAETVTQLIREKSLKYQVDPCLVESIAIYESDLNPNNISTTGAMGLMALMPINVKRYGVEDPFNAASNLDGGTRLVRDLFQMFNGNIDLTLAGYNAGDEAIRNFNGVPPYRETTDYVKIVGQIYGLLKLRSEYMDRQSVPVTPPAMSPSVGRVPISTTNRSLAAAITCLSPS